MCGSVSALIADSAYMCQEVDRFHALLKTAGDKWGGGKEMSEQVCSKSYLDFDTALECLPRFISCHVHQSARPYFLMNLYNPPGWLNDDATVQQTISGC